MNWFFLLTVLLMVTQTPVPVPRQTANGTAPTGGKVESQRKGHDAPSAPPVTVVDPTSTPSQHPHTETQGQDDQPHSVVVSKFPAVSMNKDWADWGVWVFNFLLVVVGALQFVILFKTLRAIRTQGNYMERQTGILEQSVTAARDSVAVTMNAERAWIIDEAVGVAFNPTPAVVVRGDFTLTNRGRIPARITDLKVGFFWVDLTTEANYPETPSYDPEPFQFLEIGPSGLVIAPAQSVTFSKSPEDAPPLAVMQTQGLYGSPPLLALSFYGEVTYNNGFGEGRITQFCYTWRGGEFRRIGPSGYNQAT